MIASSMDMLEPRRHNPNTLKLEPSLAKLLKEILDPTYMASKIET
jgi:hypothetical protein